MKGLKVLALVLVPMLSFAQEKKNDVQKTEMTMDLKSVVEEQQAKVDDQQAKKMQAKKEEDKINEQKAQVKKYPKEAKKADPAQKK